MKIKSKLLTQLFNIIGLVPLIHNEKIQIKVKLLMQLYVNLIDFL